MMRILFYGDSNTWGYNAMTGMRFPNRFTKQIQKAYPEDEILEEGLCGRTLCHSDPYCFEERNGLKTVSMVLKTHEPLDLVVIILGTNDAKRVYATNALTSLEKGMDLFMHEAMDPDNFKRSLKVPRFLIVTPPKMHKDYALCERTKIQFGQEGFDMLEYSDKPFRQIAKKWQADFLDLEDLRAGKLDAIHLDEEGHCQMAEKLIQKLGEYR